MPKNIEAYRHRWSQGELLGRIDTIQDRTYEMRNIAIDATLQLAKAIGQAAGGGGQAEHLDLARNYQRRAQFYTDFIEAENSMGFHADQEALRILGKAIDFARLGLAAVHGQPLPQTERALRPAPPQTVVPPAPVRGERLEQRTDPVVQRPER